MPCAGNGTSYRPFLTGAGILIATSFPQGNLGMTKKKMFLSVPPEMNYGGSLMIKETDDGTTEHVVVPAGYVRSNPTVVRIQNTEA